MSEQEAMTPEEARDLSDKLEALARDLSPRQQAFLSSVLTAGADSSEVQGYTTLFTYGWGSAQCHDTENLCTGNMFCDTSDLRCGRSWFCPSVPCLAQ